MGRAGVHSSMQRGDPMKGPVARGLMKNCVVSHQLKAERPLKQATNEPMTDVRYQPAGYGITSACATTSLESNTVESKKADLYPERLLGREERQREGWSFRRHHAVEDRFARKNLDGGYGRLPNWPKHALSWGRLRASKKNQRNTFNLPIPRGRSASHSRPHRQGLSMIHHNVVVGRKRKVDVGVDVHGGDADTTTEKTVKTQKQKQSPDWGLL